MCTTGLTRRHGTGRTRTRRKIHIRASGRSERRMSRANLSRVRFRQQRSGVQNDKVLVAVLRSVCATTPGVTIRHGRSRQQTRAGHADERAKRQPRKKKEHAACAHLHGGSQAQGQRRGDKRNFATSRFAMCARGLCVRICVPSPSAQPLCCCFCCC